LVVAKLFPKPWVINAGAGADPNGANAAPGAAAPEDVANRLMGALAEPDAPAKGGGWIG
jgi:hypothetical protein